MLEIDFKNVVGNSPEAIVIFDRSGTIVYSNKATEDLIGYRSDEIVGKNILNFLPEDSQDLVKGQLQLPVRGEGVQHRYLLEVATRSGAWITCDIVTSVLQSNDDKGAVMTFIRDMTGMKVLERKYSAEREKYLDLVRESTSIVLVLDGDLTITLANRGFMERLKYAEGEVLGKNVRDLGIVDHAVVEAMQNIASSAGEEGHRGIESVAWTNDGLKMVVSWYLSAVKEADGSVSGVLAIGHDITSKFQLEALYHSISKMLEIEHGISYLTSTANDSCLMMKKALDLILKMYGHEEGFARQVGAKVDRSPIASIGNRIVQERIDEWMIERIDNLYEPVYFPDDEETEGLGLHTNGMKCLAILPLRGKEGALGYICIGSEREIVLSQNEKDAMIGVISMLGYAYENIGLAESLGRSKEQLSLFNDILLHDISNYLVPMKGYLDLLKRSDCGEIKRREYLEHIATSDAALNEFVQDVKLLMHAKSTKVDYLMAIPLLDEIKHAIDVSVGRYEGAVVNLILPKEGNDIKVLADNALNLLFTNLITNAIKHSSPKPVVIRVERTDKNMVAVSIEDEGPGIPEDKKHMVFDRGFSEPTGKVAKSTGIGLFIVSALVQKYNGHVRIQDRVPSKPEKGASFIVGLKIAGEQ